MSMLDEALMVVDAARGLHLSESDGRTVSGLEPVGLHAALTKLMKAIERFDESTSASEAPALRVRLPLRPTPSLESVTPDAEVEQESLEAGLRAILELDADTPVPVPGIQGVAPRPGPDDNVHDLVSDGVFFDGGESAADLMRSADAIDAKLAYAVSKVGWSPRLRALAAAQRIAQENTYIEVENGETWVRIPGYVWGTLSVSIAQAALDQDLTIAFPRRDPEREYGHDRIPVLRPGQ